MTKAKTVSKADLVDRVADETQMKKRDVKTVIDAMIEHVTQDLNAGSKVQLTGFGTFERVDRAARTGRNPRTGDSVRIESTAVPKFRPGTAFKLYVAEPSTLPKSGPAAARAAAGTASEVRAKAEAAIAASKTKKGKGGRQSA